MTKYPHHEWARLIGAPVEIQRQGEVIRTGIVDEAMPDSSIIWIASDAPASRTLFEASRGFEVWVEPRQLAGPLSYRLTSNALHD